MRSEAWIQNQRAQAEKGLHQAAESDQFGFDHVMTAFDRLSFDGPTCSSAVSLAGCLRPLPRELLIRAADQGTQGLNRLGRGVQEALRSAPDQQLREATSLEGLAAVFSRLAADFAGPGDHWFDRPGSEIAQVALALQALEWAVKPPAEQVVSH